MKKLGVLLLGLLVTVPALADEVPEDEGYEDTGSYAEPVPVDDAGGYGIVDSGGSDGYDGTGSDDSYGSDSVAAEEDAGAPLELYVGGDYVWSTVSFSKPALEQAFGSDQLDSNFYRIRAGMRVLEHIGVEVQYGIGDTSVGSLETDEYRTNQFYAAYLVPTGVVLDLVEVAAAIGYAHTGLERANVSESLGGASFGLNFEVPLLTTERLEFRIGGGGSVFRAQNSARIWGYHAGLRIDFRI